MTEMAIKKPNAIVMWLGANWKITESLIVTLAAAALAVKFYGIEGSDMFFSIAFVSLGLLYYLGAFVPNEIENHYGTIANKVTYIASSICVIGLMFQIQGNVGFKIMLTVGATALGLSFIILLILWISHRSNDYLQLMARAAIVAALSSGFLLIPEM